MNSKLIYLPVSLLVLVAIGLITMEVPHYSIMIGFRTLIGTSLVTSLMLSGFVYWRWMGQLRGEDKYVAVGSTVLFSFVIVLGLFSNLNRWMAYQNCESKTVQLLHYEPRYSSAYGKLKGTKIEPNQFIITILDGAVSRTFTLRQAVSFDDVTNTINLEFCKGVLGTRYIKE